MVIHLPGRFDLQLSLGEGARSVDALHIDMSVIPGAELIANAAWATPGGRLDVACARGSKALWIDGLEGPLFAGASALVRKHVQLPAFEHAPIVEGDAIWSQRFDGGQHLLAFGDDIVICTLVCRDTVCPEATFVGELAAEPTSGALQWASSHPTTMLAGGAALVFAASVWVLATRPRPNDGA